MTKEVTLIGTFNGVTNDPWGNTRAGFSASGKLNRKDFGMIWNKTLDNGDSSSETKSRSISISSALRRKGRKRAELLSRHEPLHLQTMDMR